MENIPTWLPVVALALIDAQDRILLQQRPATKHHGGLWEFPGGKVEPSENPRDALCREIAEELAIALNPAMLVPAGLAEENAGRAIVLLLYTSRQCDVQIEAREGQAWGWYRREDAEALALAPMDRHLLAQLPL